jgi:hypothetical protein
MTKYKPLTPNLRLVINIALNKQIEELKTCKPNALVNAQIESFKMAKTLINGLPDGYPIPLNAKSEESN